MPRWVSLLKSAEQGYVNAQYRLGVLYYDGHGVSQDYQKAFEWILKAAEQELAEATKGISYIPEELRGPILKANKLYMDVAEEIR